MFRKKMFIVRNGRHRSSQATHTLPVDLQPRLAVALSAEMGKNAASGKRPSAKLKVMAKLGENIYRTTKIFRYLQAREDHLGLRHKSKWQTFMTNNNEEFEAWKAWWRSPQSERWKKIEPNKWRGGGSGGQ